MLRAEPAANARKTVATAPNLPLLSCGSSARPEEVLAELGKLPSTSRELWHGAAGLTPVMQFVGRPIPRSSVLPALYILADQV